MHKNKEVFGLKKYIRCSHEIAENLTMISEISPSGLRIAQRGGIQKYMKCNLQASMLKDVHITTQFV